MKNNQLTTQSQSFNFRGKDFTVVLINNNPHWIAKEICEELELSNPSVSLKNLKEETQKKLMTKEFCTKFNLGHFPNGLNLLTEAGVYKLVFKSRKPNAEDFTDWISEEVLPRIRKTGKYDSIEEKIQQIKDEKEKELSLKLYQLHNILKTSPNDMLTAISYNQTKQELTQYKQNLKLKEQEQILLQQGKEIEAQKKKLDNMFVIGDRVQFVHEVNRTARATGKQQSDIYSSTYGKLKDMYGINLTTRVRNKREELQNERLNNGQKPYAPATLKSKINNLTIADDLDIWNQLGRALNSVQKELLNN